MQIAYTIHSNRLKAYSLVWKFIDLLYPPHCFHCGKFGDRVCPSCWEQIEYFSDTICPICGAPQEDNTVCEKCKLEPPPLSKIRSLGEYQGVLRDFILAIKYKRNLGLAELIIPEIVGLIQNNGIELDLIIPVPLSKKRLRSRGYNQVNQWGRLIAHEMQIPFSKNGLIRVKNTKSQVKLNPEQRKSNVKDAFKAIEEQVKDQRVLLIDDVITTGATLFECANTLNNAGAKDVLAVTIARTSFQI